MVATIAAKQSDDKLLTVNISDDSSRFCSLLINLLDDLLRASRIGTPLPGVSLRLFDEQIIYVYFFVICDQAAMIDRPTQSLINY